MPYATFDDVIKRYKPITTIIGSENMQVSTADVSSIFLNDAESFIDAHIGHRYSVPLSVVPSFITQIAADLAIFNILVDHLPDKPDFFQPRYDRALEMLISVSSGAMLVNSATAATTGDNDAWSTSMNHHPVFSPVLSPEQQSVDDDRVEEDLATRIDDANTNQG